MNLQQEMWEGEESSAPRQRDRRAEALMMAMIPMGKHRRQVHISRKSDIFVLFLFFFWPHIKTQTNSHTLVPSAEHRAPC